MYTRVYVNDDKHNKKPIHYGKPTDNLFLGFEKVNQNTDRWQRFILFT